MLTIDRVSVENLRGYNATSLRLGGLTVLVGENNEGKSSMLKMLDRFMRIPESFWSGDRALNEEDFEFWYPANEALHKARRFSVDVCFSDGRSARGYGATKNAPLPLRLAIGSSGICRLNIGPPKRNEVHDRRAEKLLVQLQKEIHVLLLPPVRDARSSSFAEKVTRDVKMQLEQRMWHNKQAGAPREYRLAKDAIKKIEEIVSNHSGELRRSDDSPLASMLKSSEVRVELFPRDIYSLIEKSMFVYLSTGDHDELKVLPGEVGNGLQSLIDISLTVESMLNDSASSGQSVIAIIEEPESFLHPSAQRQFMAFLRRALVGKVFSAILTTHSPIIVDEANYEEIVLVRNQKHFAPDAVEDVRASINTTLMTTASAEVFFARTVVLVEGEGDRAFFSTLLRRIKKVTTVSSELSGLVFQVTGGCTFFSPWLRLLRSYGRGIDRPLNCLWIMDGDVAAGTPRRIFRTAADCDFALQAPDKQAIIDFGDLAWDPANRTVDCAKAANKVISAYDGHLFCCDMEWALFNEASPAVLSKIKAALGDAGINVTGNAVDLARRLGSKIQSGNASDGAKKHPYLRALIAERLDLEALPPEIFLVLTKILTNCFGSSSKVRDLFAKTGIAESRQ